MNTFISKDKRTGWRAETCIKLADGWQLDIVTRKGNTGGLVTHVTVGRAERGFVTHRLYTDYSRSIIIKPGVRCTEASVTTQHAEALAMWADIDASVREHYDDLNEPLPLAA